MISYFGKKDGLGVYIGTTEEMDDLLNNGFEIYKKNSDNSHTLIATPDRGYLEEKPTITKIKAKPLSEI